MSDQIKLLPGSISAMAGYSSRIDGKGLTGEKDRDKVLNQFESFFLFTMFKELEKTTHFTKKGFMEQTYMGIVHEKLGDYLAKKGVGIREAISRYIDRGGTKVPAPKGDNKVN